MINLLRTLDLIERTGSLSKAAQALDKVPSALSHSMAKAEKKYGTPLLQLNGRVVALTEAGKFLLQEGRPLLERVDSLEKRLRQFNEGEIAGDITLGVDINLSPEPIVQWMGRFSAAYPHVNCALVHKTTQALLEDVESGAVHLMVGTHLERQKMAASINTRSLLSSPQIFVMSHDYGHASRVMACQSESIQSKPIDPTAKAEELLPEEQSARISAQREMWRDLQWIMLESETLYDYPPRVRPWMQRTIRVPHSEAQWYALQSGLGVAMLPTHFFVQEWGGRAFFNLEQALASHRLHLIDNMPTWEIAYRAVWNSETLTPVLRWFIRQLDNIYLRTSLVAFTRTEKKASINPPTSQNG